MWRFSAFVVCLAVAVWSAEAAPQDSTFTVSSYIPDYFRDFEWTINGSFSLGGSANRSDSYIGINNIPKATFRSSSTTSGSLVLATRLIYRADTRRRLISASLPLSVSGSIRSGQSEESWPQSLTDTRFSERDDDARRWSISTQPALQADLYLTRLLFTRLRAATYAYYTAYPKSESIIDRRDTDYWNGYRLLTHLRGQTSMPFNGRIYSISATAGIGAGRVWEGQYASTAVYIVEELQKSGAVLRDPTFDEMTALTDTIRYFRLVHAVDSRLLRLEALSTMLSMLQSSGVVGDVGPYGIYMIQDVWDYFPHQSRGFGFTSSAGIGGDFTYTRDDISSTSSQELEVIYDHPDTAGYQSVENSTAESWRNEFRDQEMSRFFYYLDIAWSRPLARQWQLDLTGEARIVVRNRQEGDYYARSYNSIDGSSIRHEHELLEDDDERLETALAAELLYLYDSRTKLITAVRYSFTERRTSDDYPFAPYWRYVSGDALNRHRINAAVTAAYRLSMPTTLSAEAFLRYDDYSRSPVKHTGTDWGLSLSVSHYLY